MLQRLQNFRLYQRLRGLQKLHSFILSHFQDIKSWKGCKFSNFIFFVVSRLENFRIYHFLDINVARVAKVAKFRLYHFQDIKVAGVAKVAKFQTLSF